MLRKAISIVMLLIAAAELQPTYTIAKGLFVAASVEPSYWLWKLAMQGAFVLVITAVGLELLIQQREQRRGTRQYCQLTKHSKRSLCSL